MKIRKLFFLTLCLFILGGCGRMKRAEEREQRHQKIQDEIMVYMENKYDEKFKGDSIEYVVTAQGGHSDYGVVIPDRFPNTYVEVTRKEENGKVTISDDFQSYLVGNDFFEYINKDIKKLYPNSFTQTNIIVLDNDSAKLSLEECKKKSDLDFYIAVYIVEDEVNINDVKKTVEEYAKKYHKDFNNASLWLTVYWSTKEELQNFRKIANESKNEEYYVLRKKLEDASIGKAESRKGEEIDISITADGEIKYKVTSMKTRR